MDEEPTLEPRLVALVPRERGEEARAWLIGQGLLDLHARVSQDGTRLAFPLSEAAVAGATTPLEAAEGCAPGEDGAVDAGHLNPMAQSFATHFGARFAVQEAQIRTRDRLSYQSIAKVPPEARKLLPQGFDQVGDIAVVKFDETNQMWAAEVGAAILAAHKSVRIVAADNGVEGELRLRSLVRLAGEGPFTTIHKEFGIKIQADLERAFFTPRLAGERRRVALEVAPHERVLDAFAGVGPISLHIAKVQPTAQVVAVDINPRAIELLKENAEVNMLHNIVAEHADFAIYAGHAKPGSFSRVIMNLPHRAREFLPAALPLVTPGGIIHLYAVLPIEQVLPEQGTLRRIAKEHRAHVTILRARPIKSYSPSDLYVAFDLRVDRPRAA